MPPDQTSSGNYHQATTSKSEVTLPSLASNGPPPITNIPKKQTRRRFKQRKMKGPAHVPRPLNRFILYRRDRYLEYKAAQVALKDHSVSASSSSNSTNETGPSASPHFKLMSHSDFSKVVSQMWRNESKEVRDLYERKAKEEAALHSARNPGYKYNPRQRRLKNGGRGSGSEQMQVINAPVGPGIPPEFNIQTGQDIGSPLPLASEMQLTFNGQYTGMQTPNYAPAQGEGYTNPYFHGQPLMLPPAASQYYPPSTHGMPNGWNNRTPSDASPADNFYAAQGTQDHPYFYNNTNLGAVGGSSSFPGSYERAGTSASAGVAGGSDWASDANLGMAARLAALVEGGAGPSGVIDLAGWFSTLSQEELEAAYAHLEATRSSSG